MYEITTSIYLKLAESLRDAIGTKEFFSGVVPIYDDEVEHRLVCTLIIARQRGEGEFQNLSRITRITPIWWELQTKCGSQVINNDFSFQTLLTYFY